MGVPTARRVGVASTTTAAVTLALLLAAASPAAAKTAVGPTPTPRLVRYVDAADTSCVTEWTVTGKDSTTSDGWVWTSASSCCAPEPMPKTMITYDKGRKCTGVWTACGTKMSTKGRCIWNVCDKKTCADPVCPPKPAVMKTRWARKDGTRCVKTWQACAKHFYRGDCTWKPCDIMQCKPPCVKPDPKNMERVVGPNKTCMEAWWPVSVVIDHSTDEQVCTWKWKDVEVCHCKVDGKWKKCE